MGEQRLLYFTLRDAAVDRCGRRRSMRELMLPAPELVGRYQPALRVGQLLPQTGAQYSPEVYTSAIVEVFSIQCQQGDGSMHCIQDTSVSYRALLRDRLVLTGRCITCH